MPSRPSEKSGAGAAPPEASSSGASPVYTRTGDAGQTGLRGGQRLSKADLRVDSYGTVDELNAAIGLARALACETQRQNPALERLGEALLTVQHRLFTLGSALATLPEDLPADQRRIEQSDVDELEGEMDRCSAALAPLTSFVLPGGSPLNAALHVARTVCRRAERRCVQLADRAPVDPSSLKYVNRLSDALFVWARWSAVQLGAAETSWQPER